MFFNEILFSSFTGDKHNTKIPTQQLYVMYKIIHKNNPTVTFFQFYLYVRLFTKFFGVSNNLYLFLGYIFFSKTNLIKILSNIDFVNYITTIENVSTLNNPNTTLSIFWERFKKLKRPITNLSYFDHFILSYKDKISKYNSSGFLVLLDKFYLIKSRSDTFFKDFVQVNKPLLTAPKYSSSSINKYLSLDSTQNFEFQFLRKNKVYNKGRYSRCRQNYRTGVYMCMYLSVVSIFGLYYWFYKFSFNFTYLWWLFISFFASFFLPKVIKYRLYEPTTLISKFFGLFRWFSLLVKSFLK